MAEFIKYFWESWKRTPYKPDDEEIIEGKVVVITGSNSGIGEAAALEMAKRGAIVVMACRDMLKAAQVVEKIKSKFPASKIDLLELDLGDLSSVRNCAEKIKAKYDRVDILINNAGVLFDDGKSHKTKDGFESHIGINHLGHFLFTSLLLDLVKKAAPSRIVNVASGLFKYAKLNLDDLMMEKVVAPDKFVAYSNSKLANVYFTRALAKKLEDTGVTVYSLCPGIVKTDIGRNSTTWIREKIGTLISLTPEQGTDSILYCSLSKKCSNESGLMYRFCKPIIDMGKLDNNVEDKLWNMSEELVGI